MLKMIFALILATTAPALAQLEGEVTIVPAPQQVILKPGIVAIQNGDQILVPNDDPYLYWLSKYTQDLVAKTSGIRLRSEAQIAQFGVGHRIKFERLPKDPTRKPGAYWLEIDEKQILISASDNEGLFYGMSSFWQLLVADNSQKKFRHIPALQIYDEPRFGWRGLLLDSARHFQSVEFIKKFITVMALHKLNVLHWHLTDDQAWRLEIKKYPKLTSVGAWRIPAGIGPQKQYGGFYTQAQVKDLVAYAKRRGVRIVPEIEMPGHSTAAVMAYPEFASTKSLPSQIPHDWGVFPYLYKPGEPTFVFLQDVLNEVMELFPSEFIHVGGDEAIKDQWAASPEIQNLKSHLGILTDDELQSWFISRIGKYLQQHGRRLIGWDEIISGGLPPSAAVMSWHGVSGAEVAAKTGHDSVIAAGPTLYFDNRMSTSPSQPPGNEDFLIKLKDVYSFDPLPVGLDPADSAHILGLEGAIWTEHFQTEDEIERTSFPRALALAELAWSPNYQLHWDNFLRRLPATLHGLETLDFHLSDSPFEPLIAERFDGSRNLITVSVHNETNFGELRYTTDGSAPFESSPILDGPVSLALNSKFAVASFFKAQRISRVATRHFNLEYLNSRTSHQLSICKPQILRTIEESTTDNVPHGLFQVDIENPCWIFKSAHLTGAHAITAAVGRIPYNFQWGDDKISTHFATPATPAGELEVRLDNCTGASIAVFPLAEAVANPHVSQLTPANISPIVGDHDLCFTFTQWQPDPLWVIDQVGIR